MPRPTEADGAAWPGGCRLGRRPSGMMRAVMERTASPTTPLLAPGVQSAELVGQIAANVYVTPAGCSDVTRLWVAYYGPDHRLTVASRARDASAWEHTSLDSAVGWDSHNHPSLAVDTDGVVHLVANMHAEPLVYFRTVDRSRPLDFVRIDRMVDAEAEQRMTYPRFLTTTSGGLGFFFRTGVSGDGNFEMYAWSAETGEWSRPNTSSIIDGDGRMSAYLDTSGPVVGPRGDHHLVWVWRDAPEAESTHTISYARSTDLATWETSDGTPLALPLRQDNAEVAVAVPPGQGLINNNVRLGFDRMGRALIAYHRRDVEGHLQIHCARREDDGWISRQLTTWDVEWDFAGRGSLDFVVQVGAPAVVEDTIVVEVRVGAERMLVRASADLEPIDVTPSPFAWSTLESTPTDSGLRRFVTDFEPASTDGRRALLVWEAAPPRRDVAPDDQEGPASSALHLVRVLRP